MPRVNLNVPPPDKLKAAFLERKNALNLSDEEIGVKLGLSHSTVNRLWKTPTTDWKLKNILVLAKILGVPKDTVRECI